MKKTIILFLSSFSLLLTACQPDVNGNLPDSQFYLLGTDGKEIIDVVYYDEQTVAELKVNAYLGGYRGAEGEVTLVADDEVLLKYNETHGTSFMFLPEELYEIPTGSVKVNSESRSVSFVCKLDCQALKEMDDLDDYLLPLTLVSDNLPINPDKQSICYRFSVKNFMISLNNPGLEDVHVTSGEESVYEIPVTVVANAECAQDCHYKLYYLDGATQGAQELMNGLVGYGKIVPGDAYTVTTDNMVQAGKSVSVSTINLNLDKLPDGISYMAVALAKSDLAAENILTDAKVYRIFKDAEILPRDTWSVPYCNVLAGVSTQPDVYGTHLLLDGDFTTIWQAPWRESVNSYDPYYEGWTHISTSSFARLPMFCILDMAQTKKVTGIKLSRRDGRNWDFTKTGEIWLSNDTFGDEDLKNAFGTSVEGVLNISEAESKAWNGKQFTKVADFDFSVVNNNRDRDLTIYFDAKDARYVKVVLTEDPVDKLILSLSEINVIGK